MPVVLGHALSMKAIHGGKATNDRIDAHQIAVLRRGGMLPQASGYPAEMRATGDRLRRRRPLRRHRAGLLAHIQQTTSPYNLPQIGKKLASKANRVGGAERFPDPAVQQSLEGARALIGSDDRLLTELERDLVNTAKTHDAQTFDRWRAIPGVGNILALVRLDDIHEIRRFPRGQAFVSSCRLVKGAKASAGRRYGTAGAKLGNASLTWAFSEAAVLFFRNNPAGQNYLTRLAKTHGQGKALTVLAHQRGRAVYDRLKRETVVAMDKFFSESWSGASEPAASRAADGISLAIECWQP